ncbi:MAG TPA: histidine kinase [Methylophilus sp.]|nr:histidine kinase [Methylophilus sp.]HQQ34076.1 histidine kinase [Methylophilus sp.]
MSLRLRLNLLITALMLLFMLAVGWVILQETRVSIRERVEAATRVTVQLMDTVITSSVMNPEFGYTHEVLKGFLERLGYVRSNKMTLYDLQGKVLYESPPSKFRSNVHPPKWFAKWVAPEPEKVERLVRFGRLSIESSAEGSIREAWASLQQIMWMGLGFFILLNGMVYWMLGHWLKPLQPILKAINQMERGDLQARLPGFDLPEFDKIGHSLNRMAESLAAERQLEENRQLTHLIQSHIEEERRSLARELHDELGQYVTAIKTFAVAIANKTKATAPDVASSAQTIVAAANHIYDGMHDIIRQLRPGSLDNLGLAETLRDAVSVAQKQHPDIKILLDMSGMLDSLGETMNISIYRIVQEAINNTIKHAQANQMEIRLSIDSEGALKLTISDDGVGMDIDAVDQTNHFGLLGMRERVQGLHGSFLLESGSGQGTTIYINIPHAVKIEGKA